MIILVGHTCSLYGFIITTTTRRFVLLFCFVQTDSPRFILFTVMAFVELRSASLGEE